MIDIDPLKCLCCTLWQLFSYTGWWEKYVALPIMHLLKNRREHIGYRARTAFKM